MRTWQIIHGAGETFRWESAGKETGKELQPVPEDEEPVDTLSSRLPSMADLLLQGCSKLLEENEEGFEIAPMFKTGFGRSVSIKQSSVAKALSVLCGDCTTDSVLGTPVKQSLIVKPASDIGDDSMDYTAKVKPGNSGCNFSNTLFQTGSGKMVNVSSEGLARAKTLLGFHEDNNQCDFQGFQDIMRLPDDDLGLGWQNAANVKTSKSVDHYGIVDNASIPRSSSTCSVDFVPDRLKKEASTHVLQPRMHDSDSKPTPVKFQTAGGRSISISGDALQRAKSLLGDPELGTFLDVGEAVMGFSFSKNNDIVDTSLNKENGPFMSLSNQEKATDMFMTMNNSFVSPLCSSSKKMLAPVTLESLYSGSNGIRRFDEASHNNVNRLNGKVARQQQPNPSSNKLVTPNSVVFNSAENGIGLRKNLESLHSGCNLIRQFDEVSQDNGNDLNGKVASQQQPWSLSNKLITPNAEVDSSAENGIGLRKNLGGKFQGRQLIDISNTIGTNEKRRTLVASVSRFKRPRSSKFSTPMKSNVSFAPNGISTFSTDRSCFKEKVSFRYPFRPTRRYIREYFGVPPSENKLENMSHQFERIKPDNAEKYMFADDSGVRCVGFEAFFNMLAGLGASDQYASKEWVRNHYKWIVWKLSCYETYYPTKCAGKFLTVPNVLEELKYRYEREVNHGHRSAIKRILEGDASPTSMMVLCVSAICPNNNPRTEGSSSTPVDSKNHSATTAKVELTDGWYSLDAILDILLLQQLASGKLFVGQKLRIWWAGMCGWVGPVSPLEVSRTVNLVLHINGTYRAHWADRLGFCKGVGLPLAFKCIKSNGGAVPLTLVGITRIYPVLFKERLNDGRSVVRSERMENRVMQSYNQRRSVIIDGIVSEFQRTHTHHDSDSEEGAKILNILEKASEPEILLAEMSPDQINSFAKYQAKMEAIRQSNLEKSIEKALEDAGLSKREVNPFMRVRVVGLTSKTNEGKEKPKVGLVTIWNPTEKQQNELVEGRAYIVAGLLPTNTAIDTDTTYLQSREFANWKPLSRQAVEHFKPFFTPRKSAVLSNLGEVPLSSEFDIAAFVVFVGEVYSEAHQLKQWVFVTDSSISVLYSQELSDCLLAICFCSPYMDDDSFVPFNYNLVGSTVGFCNLIKRPKDQLNHLWVAEASENSSYFLSFDTSHCSHLKEAAVSAERWGKLSHSTIDKLREKVLFIIGSCKSSQ